MPYQPVLTDLGLAKLYEGPQLTQEGTSMGTPAYMSPEQALGEPVDARSDVYSLGILLYELSVGRLPFLVRSYSEAVRYHTKEIPPSPRSLNPNIPSSLEVIILKTLEKDPARRYASAAEMAKALEDIPDTAARDTTVPTTVADEADTAAISLLTQLQQSLLVTRGQSVFQSFEKPPENQDFIQIFTHDKREHTFPIKSSPITIGRGNENDVVLDDSKVSRHHARIDFDGSNYTVVDLKSTNGTYLKDAKLLADVPEIWTPEKIVRIGDNYIHLKRSLHSTTSDRQAATSGSATFYEGNRIGIQLESTQLVVEPGDSITSPITLVNQGEIVDHFIISILGIPANWVLNPPPITQVMPRDRKAVTFTIQPPRSSQSKASHYSLTVRIQSQSDPNLTAEAKTNLSVTPYSQFDSKLVPQKIQAGKKARISIVNQGNLQEDFTLDLQGRGNELIFRPSQTHLRVKEGETVEAEFQAQPRKRRWIGSQLVHPITAQVCPVKGEPQTLSGEVVSRGLFPAWLLPLLMMLCLLFAGRAGAYYKLIYEPAIIAAQQTGDTDGDGLTNN